MGCPASSVKVLTYTDEVVNIPLSLKKFSETFNNVNLVNLNLLLKKYLATAALWVRIQKKWATEANRCPLNINKK